MNDIQIKRYEKNPIIVPEDVVLHNPGFTVECVFNGGAAVYQDEYILLLRVAERPKQTREGFLQVPVLKRSGGEYRVEITDLDLSDPRFDFSDPRKVKQKDIDTYVYLTSMSHLRLARSKNGVDFKIDEQAYIYPDNEYESFGTEDARITKIGDTYYINYTAVSEKGITTALAKTVDFKSVEKLGIIFTTENRDVTIFPEKINGKYYAYTRPVPKQIGRAQMWMASSPDLLHWGGHQILLKAGLSEWSSLKIGGGAPPIKTEKGWLSIYHGADWDNRYCLGAFLSDLQDPGRILAISKEPILTPETNYEKEGFFGNVVFSCGTVQEGDIVKIYYGAADSVMAMAEMSISSVLEKLDPYEDGGLE